MSTLLDRATPAYARGYRDCRDRRPKLYENDGTFNGHDYDQGWHACWNDQYWSAVRENEAGTGAGMNRKFRYELRTVNSGPFKMYEILDNRYSPPRKLLTTSDQDEAHRYVQELTP